MEKYVGETSGGFIGKCSLVNTKYERHNQLIIKTR